MFQVVQFSVVCLETSAHISVSVSLSLLLPICLSLSFFLPTVLADLIEIFLSFPPLTPIFPPFFGGGGGGGGGRHGWGLGVVKRKYNIKCIFHVLLLLYFLHLFLLLLLDI